jgi:alpha-D-xyloside xylohydrolase
MMHSNKSSGGGGATKKKPRLALLALALTTIPFGVVSAQSNLPTPEKLPDGIVVTLHDAFLKVEVCTDVLIRVAYSHDRAFFARKSLVAEAKRCQPTRWELTSGRGEAILTTTKLKVKVDLPTGALSFFDSAGRPILAEKKGSKTLTPAELQGEKTFNVRQEWEANANETLYGLGQHQFGLMNIKGYDLDLRQYNSTVIVPFLVSSRGYGILWDNTSFTRFGDLREFESIPVPRLYDANGKPGGLTGTYYLGANFEKQIAQRVDPRIDLVTIDRNPKPLTRIHPAVPTSGVVSVRWEGEVEPETAGEHLFRVWSTSDAKLWIDGRLITDHWRQSWLPWYDLARVHLEANRRYKLKLEWRRDVGEENIQLLWKTPSSSKTTSLWSEVGEGVDYYFSYGPELDQVVAGYRRVTGEATLMPRWAFGLWQSRERYKSAQEVLDVLEGFRSRGIPIDNIVQDWQYWKPDAWGSHEFDPTRFPDPEKWIRTIHEKYHAQIMISVWAKFYTGIKNFDELHGRGFLYEPNLRVGIQDGSGYKFTFYDAFNPDARKLFWGQVERELFRKGIDAWWMDATEPEIMHAPTLEAIRTHMHPTALGTGSRVLNAYSLMNARGVYEGQRAAVPNQRVFNLTRSGFAGQQRYAAATWSGDVTSTWTALRKQIPAGTSFSLSGMPYWTMDAGGFEVPARFSKTDATAADTEEWRELNTRWFQYGTFVPLLRVHGRFPYREMWEFGGESHPAHQTMLKFDRLRYRLLPYIYSLAGAVTHESGTMMRGLVFDFRADAKAREIVDQFMFGPALLVSPITTYKARSRPVYLPKTAGWYDFWTGAAFAGGQTIEAPAPYESMPLYVKAGSIVPLGPELKYTGEKPADPITLFVYGGANGAFTLYEDEGLNYNYEHGAFARIPIRWDEATRTLTIGKRVGSFPGMLPERTFNVVLVSKAKQVGFSFAPASDHTIRYSGEAITLRLS